PLADTQPHREGIAAKRRKTLMTPERQGKIALEILRYLAEESVFTFEDIKRLQRNENAGISASEFAEFYEDFCHEVIMSDSDNSPIGDVTS
ncbi:MAG: hypothetical protein AAB731_01040, partial [Patescibacteria group bacterium]